MLITIYKITKWGLKFFKDIKKKLYKGKMYTAKNTPIEQSHNFRCFLKFIAFILGTQLINSRTVLGSQAGKGREKREKLLPIIQDCKGLWFDICYKLQVTSRIIQNKSHGFIKLLTFYFYP